MLVGTGLVIAVGLGLWQGTRAAWRHGSRFDRFSTGSLADLWSVPTFWLGLLLLMVFAAGVGPIPGLFPTRGMEDVDAPGGPLYLLDVAHHLVLPCSPWSPWSTRSTCWSCAPRCSTRSARTT